jgi:hypothetical protein
MSLTRVWKRDRQADGDRKKEREGDRERERR